MGETCVIIEEEYILVSFWFMLLQGILAIIFGAAMVAYPEIVYETLAYLLGVLVIVFSLSAIIRGAVIKESAGYRALLIILGFIGVIIGILAILNAIVLFIAVPILIAIWMLLSGITELIVAGTAKGEKTGIRVLMAIAGIASLIIGIYLILYPMLTTELLIWVLGVFFIILGIVQVIAGFVIQAKTES